MSENDAARPVECTLDEERKDERSEQIQSVLALNYKEAKERDDGYTVVFDGTSDSLSAVTTFVANELRCCSFAEYTIDVSPPYEETRLTITGPDGTRALFEGLIDRLEPAESKR